MLESPRVGLPNLVGQGDLVARTRGAHSGAEAAGQATIAASLHHDAVQRAEHLQPAHRVEGIGKDPHGGHDHGGHSGRHGGHDDADPDDSEDGHLVDVTA